MNVTKCFFKKNQSVKLSVVSHPKYFISIPHLHNTPASELWAVFILQNVKENRDRTTAPWPATSRKNSPNKRTNNFISNVHLLVKAYA